MKFIKNVLRFIFVPFSIRQRERSSNKEIEFFAKNIWLIVIIALFITAIVLGIIWFL